MPAGILAVALVLMMAALRSAAASGYGDGLRYVFVSAVDSPSVAVIDSRDDSIAGSLDMGLVPSQFEIAGERGVLLAVDGVGGLVSLVSVASGDRKLVELDFVPTRLVMDPNGNHVVAAAPEAGRLAVVDVTAARVVAQAQAAPFRDLLAMGDGRVLLAPERGDGLVVHDVAEGRVVAAVPPPRPGLGGFATLSRAPSGRQAYARAVAAPVVLAVDLRTAKVAGETAAAGAGKAYTNATGITLILPDPLGRSIALVPSSLRSVTAIAGEAGMAGVYSGWFDTVAFVPSTATRTVVVVDQQGGFRGDDIALRGVPGRGTVTPDGRKLYLPLSDATRVAVIDAEHRRLSTTVNVPHRPAMALMARTFGICH